eukprot:CAMPEP_0119035448 /NCGR_PEP_ID=MMETSP1177-20130426/2466_1 /TAXON_ID=2985 /ORGANISM="Ochromonas sp, Strain CCMP1899" /LENGTH=511 /DNA_ID=CAMNT_0006993717 /DNA_START=707 /DNA_END=2239 /DNA_ORIENTATION=-
MRTIIKANYPQIESNLDNVNEFDRSRVDNSNDINYNSIMKNKSSSTDKSSNQSNKNKKTSNMIGLINGFDYSYGQEDNIVSEEDEDDDVVVFYDDWLNPLDRDLLGTLKSKSVAFTPVSAETGITADSAPPVPSILEASALPPSTNFRSVGYSHSSLSPESISGIKKRRAEGFRPAIITEPYHHPTSTRDPTVMSTSTPTSTTIISPSSPLLSSSSNIAQPLLLLSSSPVRPSLFETYSSETPDYSKVVMEAIAAHKEGCEFKAIREYVSSNYPSMKIGGTKGIRGSNGLKTALTNGIDSGIFVRDGSLNKLGIKEHSILDGGEVQGSGVSLSSDQNNNMDSDVDTNMDTGEDNLNHQILVSLPLSSPSLSLVSESPGILSDVLDNDTIQRLKLLRYEKKRKFLLEGEHKGDGKGETQEIDVNLNSDSLNNKMDIDVDADMCNDTSNHQEFLGNDRSTAAFNLDVETVRSVEGSDLVDEFRATRALGDVNSSIPSSSVVPSLTSDLIDEFR